MQNNVNILVVDDDAEVLYSTKRFLDKQGYKTQIAVNGREALEAVAQGPLPDLIILDMQMTVMDGFAFMTEFNKLSLSKAIPVIVLSAYSELEKTMRLKGVKDYLVKPVTPEDLQAKVSECLLE